MYRGHSKFSTPPSLGTYDYVVIGSGPGGGPLSARLAIAGYKVLLIEAGDDQSSNVRYKVPALHAQSNEEPGMRWDFYVNHYSDLERQKRDSKMTYRTPNGGLFVGPSGVTGTGQPPEGSEPLGILYPRAGTLGGCSAHNALITIYPHKSDWDGIAKLTADKSWKADSMRKYFKRFERARYLPNGVVGHGFSGWLTTMVTDLTILLEDLKLITIVVAAAKGMGKNVIGLITTVFGLEEVLLRDINADTPGRDLAEGLYQVPLAMDNYQRQSTLEFILDTANAKQPNGSRKYHLDISLNTLATKIRFDSSTRPPKATGVDFLSGPRIYRADPQSSSAAPGIPGSVNASREVIIAAGAFNTPQILKLSGIGPAAELAALDIPVMVDSPGVGTNLQDRYETAIGAETTSEFSVIRDCTFLKNTPDPCYNRWKNSPVLKGVYGSNGLSIGIVKKSSTADGDPDLFIAGAPAYFTGYYPGFSDFVLSDKRHWVWIVLKAHSRNAAGTVILRSSNPRETPVINFNNFGIRESGDGANAQDVQALYEGMELGRQIYKNIIPLDGSFKEVWPGENVTGDSLRQFIEDEAWGHHACCTAKIGADEDATAVLDSQFRVRGTDGLRVVDASVFPKIPGFYIAVPIYMISEKAAEVILSDAL
ncbi:GMC oxidoreductase [Aaosphaeria arxii CBS 175.79]|uniref:GMC oxidoreductase n=1 Tax=Aaosphaeria arxii CBS 175.79 TaxID=1450172 RepID=A0A6A5Y859_9PLEO|nr:GMC oxidoreductase [Aaosphaeria arxii CBS 175.79]KAF2021509.1 GMC oxidoreductase [Aaosphaeria arxii CBS 175.79]